MNGSGFDGITNPSASSMGLDEAAQIRVEASPAIYFAYEVLFRLIIGGGGVSFSSKSDQLSWLWVLTDLALAHVVQ